jgi:triphosphatase
VTAGQIEATVTKKLKHALKPIFETIVDRTTIPLDVDENHMEIAIDSGQIRAGNRSKAVHEIELELKAGDPAALVEIAKRLSEEAPVEFDAKASRARLCAG